ncbi:MAG: tetratricopeptide repeat protein [Alphaproteobacteria bacterium]|nr:tetratricopeptide repeat protein [Alphaproteobacteria bacterium]
MNPPYRLAPDAGAEIARALAAAAGAGEQELAIADTALALSGAARPTLDLAPYRAHLSEIATCVAAEAANRPDTFAERVAALREALVERLGYRGDRDTYDDLRNADLVGVIDRRRGLPVALAILWIHAARAQGWQAAGLAFPGHFLIRLDAPGVRTILDPFNGGAVLETKALRGLLKRFEGPNAELQNHHYAVVSDRTVLLRLQNNIKMRLLKAEDFRGALATLERMLMIAPGDPALWHEAGLVHVGLDNLRAGVMCLEQAFSLVEAPGAKGRIAMEIQALKGRLN